MKKTSILQFSFVGWILIYLASFLAFNQKVISQTKRVDLSIEDIVDRDMLDNSSFLRRIYNKTAGFNGKTYTKPIKYYIHDENKKINLKLQPLTINYAYEISDDVERFIVDIFNSIDDYIDLDFERVFSPKKANIFIFKTDKFHDYAYAYHEFQSVKDKKILSKIVWHAGGVANKQKLKDYPTLFFEYAELLLHEIAHSLGLYHLDHLCVQEWCVDKIDPLDKRFDIKDTIMSYNYDPEESIFLSDLDIEALQTIWGVEKDTTTGLILSVPENVLEKNAEYYYESANKKAEKGDHYGAISDYTKVIELDPKDADAYYYRAMSKDELKDYNGAISDYTKATELYESDGT